MLLDKGFLACFDAGSGDLIYDKNRLPNGNAFTSSPWSYDDKIFCLNEDGVTFTIQAGRAFKLLDTNPLAADDMCRDFNEDWMTWMQWRDFSGGQMTNWGAHGVDQIQWALGMDGNGPSEIKPLTPGPNGVVAMRYANGVELKFGPEGRGPMGGAVFTCEKGKIEINRNKCTSNPLQIAEDLRKQVNTAEENRKWSENLSSTQARWHLQNWLDCIRTRQLPHADVEIGHRSISVCHLANIARAVGRPLRWDPVHEEFQGDEEANRYLERPRRHGFELPTV